MLHSAKQMSSAAPHCRWHLPVLKDLEGREELKLAKWRQENAAAHRSDMQQLEELAIKVRLL
jgi:hypothetical protein